MPRKGIFKPALRGIPERNKLVEANRGLIGKVVSKLPPFVIKCYGSEEDACQEAIIPLIRAAELWNESSGYKFSTYACLCIRCYLLDRQQSGMLFRIPDYILWRKIRAGDSRVCVYSVGDGNDAFTLLEKRSFDEERDLDGESEKLRLLINELSDERMREIVRLRYWKNETLEQLGVLFGLSKERIRQILQLAHIELAKLLERKV